MVLVLLYTIVEVMTLIKGSGEVKETLIQCITQYFSCTHIPPATDYRRSVVRWPGNKKYPQEQKTLLLNFKERMKESSAAHTCFSCGAT